MHKTKLLVALALTSCVTGTALAAPWLDALNGAYSQVDLDTIGGTASFLETGIYPNLAGTVRVTIANLSGTGLTLNGSITSQHRTSLVGLGDAPPGNYPVGVSPANGSVQIISSATSGGPLSNFRIRYDFTGLAGGGLPKGSFLYVADIDFPSSQESARVGPNLNWVGNFQLRDTASPDNPGTYSVATLQSPGSYLIQGAASGDWGAHAFQTTALMTSMDLYYDATDGAGAGFGLVGAAVPEPSSIIMSGLCSLGAIWYIRRKRK